MTKANIFRFQLLECEYYKIYQYILPSWALFNILSPLSDNLIDETHY